jgi:hypothetical protein
MVGTALAEVTAKLNKAIVEAIGFSFTTIVHDEVKNAIGLLLVSKWTFLCAADFARLWSRLSTIKFVD